MPVITPTPTFTGLSSTRGGRDFSGKEAAAADADMGAPHNNKVLVATPGTAVQFQSTSTKLSSILLEAPIGNTGNVYVGASGVNSTNVMPLEPGDQMPISFQQMVKHTPGDLYEWYVDADVAGEGITFLGIEL